MAILPLPQFEEDLKAQQEADRKTYEALTAPKTLVVRFGYLKLIGEYPYNGQIKPGCGSKIVVRTHRGTEIGEMLTSTCPNSGCSKSVSRKDMLEYIENSGGKDYPFFSEGKALRVATVEDMQKQSRLEQEKNEMRMTARRFVSEMHLPMKIVEAEPLLGGERITFYYLSEERPELRDLVGRLGKEYLCRIEMHSVGARDEARIVADYERCGQYCCCKNFLKVLKPVSMKSAKVQKATLDPLKISGRCGRLMCCLRYEDQTYEDLSKRLPRKNTRVGTPEGDGTVIDGQILTQLALVRLDVPKPDGSYNDVAVPVENLTPANSPKPVPQAPPPPRQPGPPGRGGSNRDGAGRGSDGGSGGRPEGGARGPRPDGRPDARPEGRPDARPDGRPPNPPRRDDRPRDDRPRDGGPRDDRPRSGPPQGQRPPRPQ